MITPWNPGITIQEYSRRGKENLFPDLYGCPQIGCHYKGRLRHHGFYDRNALGWSASYRLFIHRYYCPLCGRTTSLLPVFLIPHFQYCLACVFFTLFRWAVTGCPMEKVAARINEASGRFEMSYQHLGFYVRRLLSNRGSIAGVLVSSGCFLPGEASKDWVKAWCHYVYGQIGLRPFNSEYWAQNQGHFLGKRS